jgi:6,7-dimethyl-8-ribityllumazine synthase
VNILRGEPFGAGKRVAVVAARFNEPVTSALVDGARAGLAHHGVPEDAVTVAWVPGAFEIPIVAHRLAGSHRFDAVICLGAVIRGETAHFELVAGEAARGVAEVSRSTGVPCIFEVLATDTLDQARARAGGPHGNKGWEAAVAALEMASVLEQLPAEGGAR